ncbi:MAG: hypothetical protein U5L09_21790 [Bacteroidales bacterium]|nr:hypothetical protein [Bacteroidales bacterium]
MLGMMIMFGASVINLRKLSPGFKRLAAGEKDPKIPPVWCPVLTAATNAAMELVSEKIIKSNNNLKQRINVKIYISFQEKAA